uniref:Putative phospholipid-transporting ATPase IIB n=1 Tax=Lygus hesperus TaxID=30085 RepID=A0A0A9WCR6_LYGHE
MLTGDKAETATCIGISARLIDRNQTIFTLRCTTAEQAAETLQQVVRLASNVCVLIDGETLQIYLRTCPTLFARVLTRIPCVLCCRCTPTQKSAVVTLMRNYTQLSTLAIGDGGNDVAMIQAANVGVGIIGREGKQASCAADFSITTFSHLVRLLLWHGRNSYRRNAMLTLLILHRGIFITVMQLTFSLLYYFVTISLNIGWLVVGYSSFYTSLPIFMQVFDEDIDERTALMFPELYTEELQDNVLHDRVFLEWCVLAIYQGASIMLTTFMVFERSFLDFSILTYTAMLCATLCNTMYYINHLTVLL